VNDFSNFLEIQTKTGWGRALSEFADFCAPPPASLILDVGCGPGLLPSIFTQAGCRAYGADADLLLLSTSLSPNLVQSDAGALPFPPAAFHLITATNLLFLLEKPLCALEEWKRLLLPNGEICLLNPSERLSVGAAVNLADARGLDGAARDSLLNWAHIAEQRSRWTEDQTRALLARAGLELLETTLRIGAGFARFTRARPFSPSACI